MNDIKNKMVPKSFTDAVVGIRIWWDTYIELLPGQTLIGIMETHKYEKMRQTEEAARIEFEV